MVAARLATLEQGANQHSPIGEPSISQQAAAYKLCKFAEHSGFAIRRRRDHFRQRAMVAAKPAAHRSQLRGNFPEVRFDGPADCQAPPLAPDRRRRSDHPLVGAQVAWALAPIGAKVPARCSRAASSDSASASLAPDIACCCGDSCRRCLFSDATSATGSSPEYSRVGHSTPAACDARQRLRPSRIWPSYSHTGSRTQARTIACRPRRTSTTGRATTLAHRPHATFVARMRPPPHSGGHRCGTRRDDASVHRCVPARVSVNLDGNFERWTKWGST